MNLKDKMLTCRDCGRAFLFTVGEQGFYAQKGFNDPSRCPDCRASRKASRDNDYSIGWYERRERQMFPAVCAECGKAAEVPFQPRGDRPVYCADCYPAHRARSNSR